jgi:hypothetical protein
MYFLHCVSLTISVVAYFSKFSKSEWLDVISSSRRTGFSPTVAIWDLGLTQWPWVCSFLSASFVHCACESSCSSHLLATVSKTKVTSKRQEHPFRDKFMPPESSYTGLSFKL